MNAHQPAVPTERLFFLAVVVLSLLTCMAALPHWEQFARRQFVYQDIHVMVVMIATLLAMPRFITTPRAVAIPRLRERQWVLLASLFVIVCAFALRHWLIQSYLLSRDEEMVLQDAITFASGQRYTPILPEWQALHRALNTDFLNQALVGKAWLSDYKPVNALIHAGFLKIGAFAWAAPLMAAGSVLLLWRIALRLWPDRPDVRFVAGLLFICSAQVLVTAATPFSMTAHLMLNLLWLLFFMKDRPVFHACAIVTGFLATGLHQVPYHPAFALPFCALLLWQRRFGLAAVYAGSYAAIIHFWMGYPFLATDASGPSSVGMLGEIASTILAGSSWMNIPMMSADLVRLLAWNHVLVLPLVLIAVFDPRVHKNPWMLAIIGSLLLTIVMKFVFRPAQGHGWGFRYMHGLIGIGCLLAAEGWRRWVDAEPVARTALLVSTGVTVLLIWPWLILSAYWYNAPFAALDRKIERAPAQVVIFPDYAVAFGKTFVFNRPDLANRPIRLLASQIKDPAVMRSLCARYSVAILDPRAVRAVAAIWRQPVELPDPDVQRIEKISPAGCLRHYR